MLPGTAPPISIQCVTLTANAITRPPARIGLTRHTSQVCVPPSYGMLVAKTSPSRMPAMPCLRRMLWICGPNVPVKSVRPLDCATTCASASVMPQAKSSTS